MDLTSPLFLIGALSIIGSVGVLSVYLVTRKKKPSTKTLPPDDHSQDDLMDYSSTPPADSSLENWAKFRVDPEKADTVFNEGVSEFRDPDSKASFKKGFKLGLLVASEGGITYTVHADGEAEMDIEGLKVTIKGTGKGIQVPDDTVAITG